MAFLSTQSASANVLPFLALKNGCYEVVEDMHFCAEKIGWSASMGSHPDITAYFAHDDAHLVLWHYDSERGISGAFRGEPNWQGVPASTWMTDGKIASEIMVLEATGRKVLRDETRTIGAHTIRTILFDNWNGFPTALSDYLGTSWTLSVETHSSQLSHGELWALHQTALKALRIEK